MPSPYPLSEDAVVQRLRGLGYGIVGLADLLHDPIDRRHVPDVIELMAAASSPSTRNMLARAIASPEVTAYLPELVALLRQEDDEQTAWLLGQIIGGAAKKKDLELLLDVLAAPLEVAGKYGVIQAAVRVAKDDARVRAAVLSLLAATEANFPVLAAARKLRLHEALPRLRELQVEASGEVRRDVEKTIKVVGAG